MKQLIIALAVTPSVIFLILSYRMNRDRLPDEVVKQIIFSVASSLEDQKGMHGRSNDKAICFVSGKC